MKFSSKLKWITGLVVLTLLGGCNTLAPNSSQSSLDESTSPPTTSMATELDRFLNSAAQTSAVLTDTPWGKQLEVTADAPYYAASGLTCRQLVLGGSQQKALVCQQPNGSWIPSRFFN